MEYDDNMYIRICEGQKGFITPLFWGECLDTWDCPENTLKRTVCLGLPSMILKKI